MRKCLMMSVALCLIRATVAGVTSYLQLDCRTGARTCSPEGEVLHYDASWYEKGDEARITANGMVLTNGIAGVCVWKPVPCSSLRQELRLEVLFGGLVVGEERVEFECEPTIEHTTYVSCPAVEPTSGAPGRTVEIRCSRCGEIVLAATEIPALGYIRNVTARQLWPHNKVALSFTVAADIGEVKRTDEDLTVWCARGVWTNVATRILGDRSAKPGSHQIIWDIEADGLRFVNPATTFGVGVEGISLNGVQLWENGPYWAECNVGATKPEECGYYFWWGDTVGYKRNASNNGWISVKDGVSFEFYDSNCPTLYKDNAALRSAGYIDATGNLVAAHDAATAHLGAPWRMPTDAEISALISNCTTTWITTNGVYGRLVTGKGNYAVKSIFFPAAGYGDGSSLYSTGSNGCYWSSTPSSYYAWGLYFGSGYFYRGSYYRYYRQSVRPLRGFAK